MSQPIQFKGGRPEVRDALNRMSSGARAASLPVQRLDGVERLVTPAGTVEGAGAQPRPVWLYGLTENGMAFVKPIVRTNTGAWTTVGNTYELVPLAPNYPPDHFIFVAVGSLDLDDPYEVPFQVPHTTRPTKKDLICEVRGGYVYPDYRMLLVKPVAIEDLCNPP